MAVVVADVALAVAANAVDRTVVVGFPAASVVTEPTKVRPDLRVDGITVSVALMSPVYGKAGDRTDMKV